MVIDASRTVNLDPDVREILDEEMIRSKEQGITVELTGFRERNRKHTRVLSASVARAASRATRNN